MCVCSFHVSRLSVVQVTTQQPLTPRIGQPPFHPSEKSRPAPDDHRRTVFHHVNHPLRSPEPTHRSLPSSSQSRSVMDRHPGVSFASPETINSSSTVSSPHSRQSNTSSSSRVHMPEMRIGPAAVAAAIADASPSAQLLKMSEIPMLRQNKQRGSSPEELVEKDPLAAAMWRLYRSSATFLPESVRMENMTWRMMAMTLKRKEAQKYGPSWK